MSTPGITQCISTRCTHADAGLLLCVQQCHCYGELADALCGHLMLYDSTYSCASLQLRNCNTKSSSTSLICECCSGLPPAPHPCLQVLHAPSKRKGAVVHLQVGAGVLGLPSAMSYLGWPGGIIVLVLSCVSLLLDPISSSGVAPVHLLQRGLANLPAWLRGCHPHCLWVAAMAY